MDADTGEPIEQDTEAEGDTSDDTDGSDDSVADEDADTEVEADADADADTSEDEDTADSDDGDNEDTVDADAETETDGEDTDTVEDTDEVLQVGFGASEDGFVPENFFLSETSEEVVLPVGDPNDNEGSFVVENFDVTKDSIVLTNLSAGLEDGDIDVEVFAGVDPQSDNAPYDGTFISISGNDSDTLVIVNGVVFTDEERDSLISVVAAE